MIAEANENLLKQWDSIPYYNADIMGLLQENFSEQFSEQKYKEICDKTTIHKLTYKAPKKKSTSQNTFFNYLSDKSRQSLSTNIYKL